MYVNQPDFVIEEVGCSPLMGVFQFRVTKGNPLASPERLDEMTKLLIDLDQSTRVEDLKIQRFIRVKYLNDDRSGSQQKIFLQSLLSLEEAG